MRKGKNIKFNNKIMAALLNKNLRLLLMAVVGVIALFAFVQGQFALATAIVASCFLFVVLAWDRIHPLWKAIASTGDTQLTPNYLIGIFMSGLIAAQAVLAQSQQVLIQAGSFVLWNWILNYVVIILVAPRVLKTFDIQNFGDEFVRQLLSLFKIKSKHFYKTSHSAPIALRLAQDMKKYGHHSNFFAALMFGGAMLITIVLMFRELLNGFGIGLFAVNAQFTALESLVNPATLISHHWEVEIMVVLFVFIAFLTGGGGNKKFASILSIVGVSFYILEGSIGFMGISANIGMFFQMLSPVGAYEWITQNPELTAVAMGATGFAFIPALQATLGLATSGIEGQVENTRSNGGVKNTQHLAFVNMIFSVITNLGILIFASQIEDHSSIKQADYFYLPIREFVWYVTVAVGISLLMGINASSTLVVSIQSFHCHTIGIFLDEKTRGSILYPLFQIRGEKGKEHAIIVPIALSVLFVALAYTMSHEMININYGVVIFITLGLIGSFIHVTLIIKILATRSINFETVLFLTLSGLFVLLQVKMFPTEKALSAYVLWGLIFGIGGVAWRVKRAMHKCEENDELHEHHDDQAH
jgi:hypothetical protein